MKRTVRLLGLALGLGAVLWWSATGANRGWTKTSVPKRIKDEVTGIEAVVYERRLVPGLDLLGAALLGGGSLAAASFLFSAKKQNR